MSVRTEPVVSGLAMQMYTPNYPLGNKISILGSQSGIYVIVGLWLEWFISLLERERPINP